MILHHFHDLVPQLRCNVFAYDYSGYGHSSGEPSEEDIYADIEASYQYLREVLGIPWQQIVLFGRSLGTAASTHLASLSPVGGVILQCPMLSVYRIALNSRFTLPGDSLTNIDRLRLIDARILIIHGTRDEIVPFWHGVEIHKNCKNAVEPYWVEGGDHNNLETLDNIEFVKRVSKFLDELEGGYFEGKLVM